MNLKDLILAKEKIIFDNGTHKCIMFSIDDEAQEDNFLSVNQYLLIDNDSAVLIDPGTSGIFYELCDAISTYISIDKIKFVFFSHQDPDVAGSISEWSVSTPAKLVLPAIWTRFMTHYGVLDNEKIFPIPDKGTKIPFGKGYINLVPAHFLHSPGNFSLYDSESQILFSGDIGAAIAPPSDAYKEISSFEEHIPYLESFHKRYMANNIVCKEWVKKVLELSISTIAPQHGALFRDDDVNNFLNWFNDLECGSDIIENIY